MKSKKFFATGEFAKLCKTTKETLFHYDRLNLLKPRHVSENGYRRYAVEQFFDFDLIAMLQETGSSLKEIKAYLRNMSGEDFLSLIEGKRLVVKKERERLAQREMMLQDMAACTREALNFDYDTFLVQHQEEERLEIFAIAAISLESTPDTISEYARRAAEYSEYYDKQEKIPRFPYGSIIGRDDVLQAHYLEQCIFSRATRSTPRSLLHIKPEGKYAVIAHRGTIQAHVQILAKLLRHIKTAGLTVTGDAYVYDMMSYSFQGSSDGYASKYCVLVE